MAVFPSMKAGALLAVLTRDPLNYEVVRQVGSHRRLASKGRPPLTFAFHPGVDLAPGLVRAVLVKGVGLSEAQALALL